MDKQKLREQFHSFFNKLNNISFIAGSTKMILQEEDFKGLSSDALKDKIAKLIRVLGKIEENAIALDQGLRKYYESVKESISSE